MFGMKFFSNNMNDTTKLEKDAAIEIEKQMTEEEFDNHPGGG